MKKSANLRGRIFRPSYLICSSLILGLGAGFFLMNQRLHTLENSIEQNRSNAKTALIKLNTVNRERVLALKEISILKNNQEIQKALTKIESIDLNLDANFQLWETKLNDINNKIALAIIASSSANKSNLAKNKVVSEPHTDIRIIEKLDLSLENQRLDYEQEIFKINKLFEQYKSSLGFNKKTYPALPSSTLYQQMFLRSSKLNGKPQEQVSLAR